MELFFPGVGSLMTNYESGSSISAQESGFEQAQQSLAKYPSSFRLGSRFLCKLEFFAHAEDDRSELHDRPNRKIDWLKYICSLPLETVLAAAECDHEPDGKSPRSRLQRVQAMADLAAQRSFEKLESLAAQTIQNGAAHSFPMVAMKVCVTRAIAGM
jgi:hypothetical protein